MSRRVWLLAVWMTVAAACGGSSTALDRERQTLMSRDREWSAGVRDIEKFLSFYAPEGSLYLPGMPVATGRENIRRAANIFADAPGFSIRWSPTKADVSAGGDLGYVTGAYQISRNDAAGKPGTENGKYVEVWKKQGDEWRAVEFIFNPDSGFLKGR
jgi:ketosteroid isomerase-like protein